MKTLKVLTFLVFVFSIASLLLSFLFNIPLITSYLKFTKSELELAIFLKWLFCFEFLSFVILLITNFILKTKKHEIKTNTVKIIVTSQIAFTIISVIVLSTVISKNSITFAQNYSGKLSDEAYSNILISEHINNSGNSDVEIYDLVCFDNEYYNQQSDVVLKEKGTNCIITIDYFYSNSKLLKSQFLAQSGFTGKDYEVVDYKGYNIRFVTDGYTDMYIIPSSNYIFAFYLSAEPEEKKALNKNNVLEMVIDSLSRINEKDID